MQVLHTGELSLGQLSRFGEAMREADVNECRAAGWRDPLAGVLEALHWSDLSPDCTSWAFVDRDSRVGVLGGLAESSEVDNDILLQPWMVAAAWVTPRQLLAAGKELHRRMEMCRYNEQGERRVFWNTVWSKAAASHRFIEHFGYRIDWRPESILTHPKTGELFYPFES